MPRGGMPRLTLALAFLKAASSLPLAFNTTTFNGTSGLESPTKPGESFYSTSQIDASTLPLESGLDATKSETHFNLTQLDQSTSSPLSSQLTALPSESDPDVDNYGPKLESRMNDPNQGPSLQDWIDWQFIQQAETHDPPGVDARNILPSIDTCMHEYRLRNPSARSDDARPLVRARITALRQIFAGYQKRGGQPSQMFHPPVAPQGLAQDIAQSGLLPFGEGRVVQNFPAVQTSSQGPSLQDWVDWNFISQAEARDPPGQNPRQITPSLTYLTKAYWQANPGGDRNAALKAVRNRITALRMVFDGKQQRNSRAPPSTFHRPQQPQDLAEKIAQHGLVPFRKAQAVQNAAPGQAGPSQAGPSQPGPAGPSQPQRQPQPQPAPAPQAGPSRPPSNVQEGIMRIRTAYQQHRANGLDREAAIYEITCKVLGKSKEDRDWEAVEWRVRGALQGIP